MPTYEITAPDGSKYDITAPEGATEKQILAYAKTQFTAAKPQAPSSQSEQAPEELALGQARLENLTRGGSLGMSDVIVPAIGAGIAKLFGGDATAGLSYEDLFTQAQGDIGQRRQQFREERPVEAIGTEIAASLPTGGALFKGAQAAGMGTKAALAGTGALEGFGFTEGDITDKAGGAVLGGVMAPATAVAFSAAGPGTIKAVRKFSEAATEPVKTVLSGVFNINPVAARQFMQEGVPVSALAISDNPTILRLGSILKGTFGSTKVMERNTQRTLDRLTAKINKKAYSTGREITTQEAGLAVQRGVENYIDKFQKTSSKLYARVGRYIPDDTFSGLSNTKNFVQQEIANVADAPNLQAKITKNKALSEAVNAIEDAGEQGLRYSNLRRYRTEVGSLIKQNVISGEDNALAKRVYGVLTEDMKALASAKGPKALRAFNNANAFYNRGLEQIEQRLGKYVGTNADPSRILAQVKTSAKSGDFKLRSIMKAVAREDRPVIRDAVLQQTGINSKGDFSTALFFRDYNKISREAKDVLFGADDVAFRQSLDRLASISKRLTESGRFTNTSRSADNLGNVGLLALGVYEPTTAIKVGVSANLGARLLTNRSFAKILAKYSQTPIKGNAMSKMVKELEDLAVNNLAMENDITAYLGLLGAATATLAGDSND